MSDPIIEALFEGDAFEDEAPRVNTDEYGKGDWRDAVLMEAIPQAGNQYGRSVTIKVNLKGDEGMPFTFFVDAPAQPHANGEVPSDSDEARYRVQLNRLKTIVHATGTWVTFKANGKADKKSWPSTLTDFGTDEAYDKLVSLFQTLVGKRIGLRVKYRTYTKKDGSDGTAKDVWGLEPRNS